MGTYVIKEMPHLGGDSAATMTVNGSLAAAKRCATRYRTYNGGVLIIETARGELMAYKKNGEWFSEDNWWDDE